MQPKLAIAGASGHALVVADILRLAGEYEIIGFLDDDVERHHALFCGLPILGGFRDFGMLRPRGVTHLILAIGDCRARMQFSAVARSEGFSLATAVHPRAIVAADVRIGAGTVVAAGAVVNPGSDLGENVIINTSASVDHECRIEDGAHVSPGAHLAGRVHVGRMTWVGAGAIIRDRVRIGRASIIGAGSVVLTDIPDGVVAYGVPARVKREVTAKDRC
jgi:sugar O-acyltransferase (sialic acid O-acetyltransferase NeuD family)